MKGQWIISTVFVGVFANLSILYYLFFTFSAEKAPSSPSPTPEPSLDMVSASSASCEGCLERIVKLEQSIDIVNDKVNDLEVQTGKTPSVVTVKQQATTTSASSSVNEITIPLGSGETNSKEWTDIPGMNAYIDTKRYSSISSVRFEAVLRIPNAQGWVHARLYNKTDDRPVWNSEVISETDKSLLKQSEPITLDAGNKLYQVQLKSTIGVQALIDSGRIKIQL